MRYVKTSVTPMRQAVNDFVAERATLSSDTGGRGAGLALTDSRIDQHIGE
jgi:hypothetical protein